MYFYAILTLVLASLTSALPSPLADAAKPTSSLAMTVGGKNVSLVAIPQTSSPNSLIFVGSTQRRGTPVYVNGTSPNAAVDAVYQGASYGLATSDVGDNYGIVTDIFATKGYQSFTWYAGNGAIFPKLYAGSNLVMACNRTISGANKSVLSFGVVNSNGSIPYGCSYTQIFLVS